MILLVFSVIVGWWESTPTLQISIPIIENYTQNLARTWQE